VANTGSFGKKTAVEAVLSRNDSVKLTATAWSSTRLKTSRLW